MLCTQDVSFGVGHQSQHAARGVTEACNVALRIVRIVGICGRLTVRSNVSEHGLLRLRKALKNPFLSANEFPFAVRHGHVHPRQTLEKDAVTRLDEQIDPAVFEFSTAVVREGGEWAILVGWKYETGFQKNLEAVADSENQFFVIAEFANGIGEKVLQFHGEHFPGRDIVTVTESAGDDENFKLTQQLRRLAESIDVKAFGLGACRFEGECGFAIAIRAGSAKYENLGSRHWKKS